MGGLAMNKIVAVILLPVSVHCNLGSFPVK